MNTSSPLLHFRFNKLTLIAVSLGISLSGARLSLAQFVQHNLVSDIPGLADFTDPDLRNPWGVTAGPTTPFWVADNASGLSTLYNGAGVKQGLIVTIPGMDPGPTGVVFNPNSASSFGGDLFLFTAENGGVFGWRGALGTTAETLATPSSANVYKGTTIDSMGGNTYLLAANFRAGTIDVYKGNAGAPDLLGKFLDPNLPAGYAPFNVQNLGGKIYVTYALQDGAKHDDVAGAGHGFVDVFDLNGVLLNRVGSMGTLNSPWGLALAPAGFGILAGDLLVGNFGDGRINIFDSLTGLFIDQLRDQNGNPIAIGGLWALIAGNNAAGVDPSSIYFSAGPNDEMDGLFGRLSFTNAVPDSGTSFALLLLGLAGIAVGRRAFGRVQA